MNFTIEEEFLTDVLMEKTYYPFLDKNNPTNEELIKCLKGGFYRKQWNEDHPKFAELRNLLEKDGYIETSRNSWNGDIVLKPFTLNGKKFVPGNKFPCASSLGVKFKCRPL